LCATDASTKAKKLPLCNWSALVVSRSNCNLCTYSCLCRHPRRCFTSLFSMPHSYAQNSSNLGKASRWGRHNLVTPSWRYRNMKRRCWKAPPSFADSAQDLNTRSLTPMPAVHLRVVAMRKLRRLSSFDTRTSSSSEMSRFVMFRLVIQEQSVLDDVKSAVPIVSTTKGLRAPMIEVCPMLDRAKSFQTRRLSSCLLRG
jgi:hypothetical protein